MHKTTSRRHFRAATATVAPLIVVALLAATSDAAQGSVPVGFGGHAAAAGHQDTASGGAGELVVSADRRPQLDGEIYRIGLNGHRTDLSNSPADDTYPTVSANGRQVAFVSDRGGRSAIYAVGIDGRGLTRLYGPIRSEVQSGMMVGWAPDGTLAATPDGRLELLRPGKKPRFVTHDPFDGSASWSPDGTRLALGGGGLVRIVTRAGRVLYSQPWARSGVQVVWSHGGRLGVQTNGTVTIVSEQGHRLARYVGHGFAWSPNGDRLAIVEGAGQLAVRDDGTGRAVVRGRTFAPTDMTYPGLVWFGNSRVAARSGNRTAGLDVETGRSWRPTLAQWNAATCGCTAHGLSWRTGRQGRQFTLVARRTGGHPRPVSRMPGCNDDGGPATPFGPIEAAAGATLVYEAVCTEPYANLYRVRTDGTGLTRLTSTQSEQTSPRFSPDGKQLAFEHADLTGLSCKGCPETVWVANADGSHAHALTKPLASDNSTYDTGPSWSPDGKTILFVRSTPGIFPNLNTVPAAGGPVTSLHQPGGPAAWGPHKIAYVGGDGDVIREANPDGSGRVQMSSKGASALAWSPTGQLAAVEIGSEGRDTVVVFGTRQTRLKLPFGEIEDIAWSPDGSRLALAAAPYRNGPSDAYTVGADGRGLERVTRNLGVLGVSWRP